MNVVYCMCLYVPICAYVYHPARSESEDWREQCFKLNWRAVLKSFFLINSSLPCDVHSPSIPHMCTRSSFPVYSTHVHALITLIHAILFIWGFGACRKFSNVRFTNSYSKWKIKTCWKCLPERSLRTESLGPSAVEWRVAPGLGFSRGLGFNRASLAFPVQFFFLNADSWICWHHCFALRQ